MIPRLGFIALVTCYALKANMRVQVGADGTLQNVVDNSANTEKIWPFTSANTDNPETVEGASPVNVTTVEGASPVNVTTVEEAAPEDELHYPLTVEDAHEDARLQEQEDETHMTAAERKELRAGRRYMQAEEDHKEWLKSQEEQKKAREETRLKRAEEFRLERLERKERKKKEAQSKANHVGQHDEIIPNCEGDECSCVKPNNVQLSKSNTLNFDGGVGGGAATGGQDFFELLLDIGHKCKNEAYFPEHVDGEAGVSSRPAIREGESMARDTSGEMASVNSACGHTQLQQYFSDDCAWSVAKYAYCIEADCRIQCIDHSVECKECRHRVRCDEKFLKATGFEKFKTAIVDHKGIYHDLKVMQSSFHRNPAPPHVYMAPDLVPYVPEED